jgi:4-amino-4-deoxy-L-arabinose transferase-like glycosyltransferase
MKVFGTGFYIERIYSVLCIIASMVLTAIIYRKMGLKQGFIPLLFMIAIPLFSWCAVNNLIENTLLVFVLLSVLFYFLSLSNRRVLYLVLSGLSLAIGFATKGFVAFFPLSLPIIHWITMRKYDFKRAVVDTAIIVMASVLPLIIIILSVDELRLYFSAYLDDQVLLSLSPVSKERNVDSRWHIIYLFLREIIPICVMVIIYFLIAKRKAILPSLTNNKREGLMMILLSLTAVLPMAISMKQNTFYLLPALPFVAMGAAAFIDKSVDRLLSVIDIKGKSFALFKYLFLILLGAACGMCIYFSGSYSRDKELLTDMEKICEHLPAKTIVYMPKEMETEYSLIAYYARYYKVYLGFNPNDSHYLLVKKDLEINTDGYQMVSADSKTFVLYKQKVKTPTKMDKKLPKIPF